MRMRREGMKTGKKKVESTSNHCDSFYHGHRHLWHVIRANSHSTSFVMITVLLFCIHYTFAIVKL